jgi:hypothetical protein
MTENEGATREVHFEYSLAISIFFMRAHFVALVASTIVLAFAGPAFAQTAPSVIKNIKTDFAAKCDAVADDTASFDAFATWAKQWQQSNSGLIELLIPSGSKCTLNTYSSTFTGIKKLLVVGYGASLSGNYYHLAGDGQYADNIHSARTQSVSAGANSVTLKDPSKSSLFQIGAWAMITGFDMMGYGYPTNPHFFEFVQITSVNSSTGVVTFAAPLKNTYLSTWPHYNDGGQFEPDHGGPATLYAMKPTWDTEVEWQGINLITQNEVDADGRSATFRDVTLTQNTPGQSCFFASQNLSWSAINTTALDCTMEVDKLITNINLSNVKMHGLNFQSSSVDQLTVDGSYIQYLVGTPKRSSLSNSTFDHLQLGPGQFGRSDEFSCTNCVIKDFNPAGLQEKGPAPYDGIQNDFTMQNGTIVIPNSLSAGAVRSLIPGSHMYFEGATSFAVPFTVVDVTQDSANTYVKTDLTGGFPSSAIWYSGTQLWMRNHPAPKFSCVNCTDGNGNPRFVNFPSGAPALSYYTNTQTISNIPSGGAYFSIFGKPVSLKINVTKPYTGSVYQNATGQMVTFYVKPDNSVDVWWPGINLKIAGERIITPTGITCNGAPGGCAGDSIGTMPTWITLSEWSVPDMTGDPSSAWPTVTYEWKTDQEFNNSVTPPPPPLVPPPPPPPVSTKFTLNQSVQVSSGPLNVRSCAGISCSLLGTQSTGALGTIVGGPVAADGYNWWNVNYAVAPSGWSVEDYLTGTIAPPPPPPPVPPPPPPPAPSFNIGARVKTTANLNVRSKPTNGKKNTLCTQPAGSLGSIVGGPTVATGYTWWNVNYDSGCDGWSVQNYLTTTL